MAPGAIHSQPRYEIWSPNPTQNERGDDLISEDEDIYDGIYPTNVEVGGSSSRPDYPSIPPPVEYKSKSPAPALPPFLSRPLPNTRHDPAFSPDPTSNPYFSRGSHEKSPSAQTESSDHAGTTHSRQTSTNNEPVTPPEDDISLPLGPPPAYSPSPSSSAGSSPPSMSSASSLSLSESNFTPSSSHSHSTPPSHARTMGTINEFDDPKTRNSAPELRRPIDQRPPGGRSSVPDAPNAATPPSDRPTKTGRKSSKAKSPPRPLDRIDELDDTNPLGLTLHHGGPYEALTRALTMDTGDGRTNRDERRGRQGPSVKGGPRHPNVNPGRISVQPGQIFPSGFAGYISQPLPGPSDHQGYYQTNVPPPAQTHHHSTSSRHHNTPDAGGLRPQFSPDQIPYSGRPSQFPPQFPPANRVVSESPRQDQYAYGLNPPNARLAPPSQYTSVPYQGQLPNPHSPMGEFPPVHRPAYHVSVPEHRPPPPPRVDQQHIDNSPPSHLRPPLRPLPPERQHPMSVPVSRPPPSEYIHPSRATYAEPGPRNVPHQYLPAPPQSRAVNSTPPNSRRPPPPDIPLPPQNLNSQSQGRPPHPPSHTSGAPASRPQPSHVPKRLVMPSPLQPQHQEQRQPAHRPQASAGSAFFDRNAHAQQGPGKNVHFDMQPRAQDIHMLHKDVKLVKKRNTIGGGGNAAVQNEPEVRRGNTWFGSKITRHQSAKEEKPKFSRRLSKRKTDI